MLFGIYVLRITFYGLVSDEPTKHMPPDHHAQNLRGALADRQQALVAVDPFDRELLAIAIAAEYLDRVAAGTARSMERRSGSVDFCARNRSDQRALCGP